jgi:hypothetical protein
MLRAAVLLSFLRRVLRFSTTGHPGALGACYVASWQLPRLDSHQLADDSFQGTPAEVMQRWSAPRLSPVSYGGVSDFWSDQGAGCGQTHLPRLQATGTFADTRAHG